MSVPQRRVPAAQRGVRLTRRTPVDSTITPDAVRRATRPGRVKRPAPATAAPHPVELAGLLHELTVQLLGADRLTQALDRLAAFGASALPGVARCSVALIGEGGPLISAAAGRAGETFDQVQYAESTGPGLEAARTRSLVTSGDLAGDERWPVLAAAARADGHRAVVAVPLDVRRSSVGALSLYLDRSGDVDPNLLLTAMAVAGQAEVLLGELHRREALTEGAEVDRAVGVIIAQRGCGVQEAYAVLQESAQRLGLDRRTVAERLVAAAARNA
ncbi:GAF and ANTAR domain-containing protein [Actinoplanes sp. NPDC024001]|uniref:GAF and ANTAR domain-containing protein n=1 Tax=Actinoplanes sp. NPDC024001 TaxID=3154598 RepID=UPI0033EC0E4C